MSSFQECELKGRSWFTELLTQSGATDLAPTTDIYDKVDYYFTNKGKKIVAETKCRDLKYLNYDEHIIEETKYWSLREAKIAQNCDDAYYVNFFGEDVAIIYTINAIIKHSRKDTLWCNKTTSVYSGKKDKEVYYIPMECGQMYKKEDGIWCKC